MKKILTILLVLVLSFSLFVSCDPNINKKDSDDDNKTPTGGGTTQVDPSKEDPNNNGEKPSQDVPDKEAEGTTFSEIEINQLMGSYKGLYETLIKETPKIEGQPSKIELNVTAKFPDGLVLATEEDYKKAAEDRNDKSYLSLSPYTYHNIYFEGTCSDWSEEYKEYNISNSTIKYSNIEDPTKNDYITDEEGRVIKDFDIFGYYHAGSHYNGEYIQDASVILNNLSGQKAIINGSLKLYGSDNTAITISTEGLTIAVSNDSEVSVKGDVKVISGDKTYVFTLDFSIKFEDMFVYTKKYYDGNGNIIHTSSSIIPKKYTLTINNLGISSELFGVSLDGIASMSLNEQGVMESFKIIINDYTDSINGKENLKLNALFEIKPEDITNINNGGDLLAILDYLKIYEFKYSGQEYSADSVKAVIKSMIENMQKNPSNP